VPAPRSAEAVSQAEPPAAPQTASQAASAAPPVAGAEQVEEIAEPAPPTATPRVTAEAVAVTAVVVIGVAARFVAVSPLWLDEALSVNIASLPLGDIPEALRHDGHPPLYYAVLHLWIEVAGRGDLAVRALSAVFGLGGLALVFLAARRAAGARAARWALLIAAVVPFGVRYATEARMYTLVMALVAAGYLAVRWAVERPSLGRLAVVAGVSGALLLTHYWAVWLVGATVGVLGWLAWRGRGRAQARVAAAVAAGGILVVPWLPSLLYQLRHTGTPWAGPVRPTVIVQTGLQDFGSAATGVALAEATLLGLVLAVLVLVGVFGRTVDDHRLELDVRTVPGVRPEAAVVGATVLLASIAGYLTGTTFASRYLAVVFPLFVVVAGAGLAKLPGRPARWVVASGVVALSLVGLGVNALLPRTQAGEVAEAVAAGARPGDIVVFCPDQLGPAVGRELPAGLTQLAYPGLGSPARVDWVDYTDRYEDASPDDVAAEVAGRAGADGRLWVVTAGGYNVSDHCADFVSALGGLRGTPELVVAEDPDVFEPGSLLRFGTGG
jgi:mannosyltransferase